MDNEIKEVVIVAYGRSAIGRAKKGSLRNTHPVDYAGQILKQVISKLPNLDVTEISDVVIGCSKCEEVQGYNIARLICFKAGLPNDVPAQTINRFCSSSLQAIYTAANIIRCGDSEIAIAGGVESMSLLPMGTREEVRYQWLNEFKSGAYMPMGITAENVAEKYKITREEMDAFALSSHIKAALAQDEGRFSNQILPVEVLDDEGNLTIFEKDEGIRRGITIDDLTKLKAVFQEDGIVTAGTSSQMSDASAMVVLMSAEKAKTLGIKPIAKFVSFAVTGVDPEYMGIGPVKAVPMALKRANLNMEDIDIIELNEAFAAQAIPCIRELGMPLEKVNVNGGAISMGHPLGATGAILTCKALDELERTRGRYALITMCIGGGMGAAGIFERI